MDFQFLPNISIRTEVNSLLFIDRFRNILKDQRGYKFEKNKSNSKLLLFGHDNSELPADLSLILRCDKKEDYRVFIEAQSIDWVEKPVDYDKYVEIIGKLTRTLLKVYNKLYSTNRRLTVPSKDQITPKLSKHPESFFNHFLEYANRTFLSQPSWRHYYSFIICCHSRNQYLGSEEITYLLKNAGFNDYYCDKLYSIFEHGWGILEQLPESKRRAWRKKMREKIKEEQRQENLDTDHSL